MPTPVIANADHAITAPGRRPSRRWYLAAAAALALVGAACSSDASGTDAGPGTGVSLTTGDSTVDSLATDISRTADTAGETASSLAAGAQDAANKADSADAQAAADDLAAALRANGLTALAALVEQVDVTEIVGDGEFTLFAPNDQAFLAVPPATAAGLAADPQRVDELVRNHVVKQRITADELAGRSSITTESGESLAVADSGGELTVGGATVVTPDIDAGNGVVHVVDKVLVP